MNTEAMIKFVEVFAQLGDDAQTVFVVWVLSTKITTLAVALVVVAGVLRLARLITRAAFETSENTACLRWLHRCLRADSRMIDEGFFADDRAALKDAVIKLTKEAGDAD